MDQTFGQAFGALILEKRGQEGLTQLQLAVRAFDDESKVRRIIELESGSIRRPQAKTIDPLVACLGITREELAACRSHATFTDAEVGSIGLTRQVLEGLALRFEHDNPDAPETELLAFLQAKARELKELRARLSQIEAQSGNLKRQLSAANRALVEGRFDEADDLLAEAEESHQRDATLKAINAQVDIRASRGDAALFRGAADQALSHYIRAAEYAEHFDSTLVVERLVEYAGRIYELARRSWHPQFSQALDLIDRAIARVSSTKDASTSVATYYCSALLRQTEAQRTTRRGSVVLIDEAIEHCSIALKGIEADEGFDWARCTFLLANCYLARSQIVRKTGGADIAKAIELYESYLSRPRTDILDAHRPAVLNSLASAQRRIMPISTDKRRKELSRSIKGNLRRAIEQSADANKPDIWAAAQYNLAAELYDEIKEAAPGNRRFLLVQAIAACQASVEAFPETAFSTHVAKTNLLLGRLLIDFGSNVDGDLTRVYFARAQGVLGASRLVFEEGSDPVSLAHVNFYLAFLAVEYAEIFPEGSGDALGAARQHLEAALGTAGTGKDFKEKCETLEARIRAVSPTVKS